MLTPEFEPTFYRDGRLVTSQTDTNLIGHIGTADFEPVGDEGSGD